MLNFDFLLLSAICIFSLFIFKKKSETYQRIGVFLGAYNVIIVLQCPYSDEYFKTRKKSKLIPSTIAKV